MSKSKLPVVVVAGLVVAAAGYWAVRSLGPGVVRPGPAGGWSPSGPQPRLATVRLWLGPQEVVAELAREPAEIMTGMMFRTNLAPNEGMLFLLRVPQQASFYMRNTLLPLSCAYINGEGVILEVHDMKPRDETPILSATRDVEFVLEMNQGWFETNHIGPGTVVVSDRGKLRALER